jgi:hypothetical protein
MLDKPTLHLTPRAQRVLVRAGYDAGTFFNPIKAAQTAQEHGLNPALANTIADLRNKLSLKVSLQKEDPTPKREKTIRELAEAIARMEATGDLDASPLHGR